MHLKPIERIFKQKTMRTYTPPRCENCISYDQIKNSCREKVRRCSAAVFRPSISPALTISVLARSIRRKTDQRNGFV
nr:MAG TPA: hypothetical protein [Caudoviricetes sp.]